MLELLHIPYSPWSEKARWALDVSGRDYRSRYYQPLIGEPALRWKLRKMRGNVSVPVLFDGGRAIPDSYEIAKFADRDNDKLFPAGHDAEIAEWNRLSEQGLAAGRAVSLQRVLKNPTSLMELVPKNLRGLGKVAVGIAAGGVKRTLRKYGADGKTDADHQATLVAVLEALRKGLAGRDTILPTGFSYADIAMAQVLSYVKPPDRGLKLGAGNRESYGDPTLAEAYPDLVAWRDRVYAAHRPESRAVRA